jgi:hypothetical protein
LALIVHFDDVVNVNDEEDVLAQEIANSCVSDETQGNVATPFANSKSS